MQDEIDIINPYLAPDGGMRLDLNDRAVLDGQETVANQNPVLFLAYAREAIGERTIPWREIAAHHARIVSVGPGRYLRRKGDPLRQSHDNVLGWAYFSAVYGDKYAKEIYDFAKWRFFIYDPHHRFSLDPRCFLQPSHLFTLKLAMGRKPGWLSTLWFTVSCVVADHSSDYYLKSMLRSVIVRKQMRLLSKNKKKVINWGMSLMEKRRGDMCKWYQDYFHQDEKHPVHVLWQR